MILHCTTILSRIFFGKQKKRTKLSTLLFLINESEVIEKSMTNSQFDSRMSYVYSIDGKNNSVLDIHLALSEMILLLTKNESSDFITFKEVMSYSW